MSDIPRVPFAQSAEFKAAVAEAAQALVADQVKAAVAEAMASIRPLSPGVATPGTPDLYQLFNQMALTMAEVSDQGTNRKRVAPEILAQREAARLRMHGFLRDAYNERTYPRYKAVAPMFLNDRYIDPFKKNDETKKPEPVEFAWSGVPSEAMRPINDVAERIYHEFRLSIGSTDKVDAIARTPMWLTNGGLVIKGEPPASMRSIPTGTDSGADAPRFHDSLDLNIERNIDGKPTRILGNMDPPVTLGGDRWQRN